MLTPIHDRIIVKKLEIIDKVLPSGLVLTEAVQEKPQEGTVIAVGNGRYNDFHQEWVPLTIEPGDRVFYSKYGGTDITVDGEDLLILTERDCLAVEKQ